MTFEQVQSKLDILKTNLQRLDAIPQDSLEQFSADFRNVGAALYLLQTSIQVLIDLASYLVALHALPTPVTSRAVFEHLEQADLLPAGSAQRFGPIVGFRSRIVHLYDRVDERRVYEVLTQHRHELAELFDLLLAVAEQTPTDP